MHQEPYIFVAVYSYFWISIYKSKVAKSLFWSAPTRMARALRLAIGVDGFPEVSGRVDARGREDEQKVGQHEEVWFADR